MQFRLSVVIALCSLLAPLAQAFAQGPPDALLFTDDFVGANSLWQPVSGTWSVSKGTYGNTAAGASNLSVVTTYESGIEGQPPTTDVVDADDFTVSARVNNQGTTDEHLVGLVYGYQDAQNYYEAVVAATGAVKLRTVMNGVAVEDVSRSSFFVQRNTWIALKVRWVRGVATFSVNGIPFTSASQPEFTQGKVGVVAHNALGRFDAFRVSIAFGDQGFFEDFNQAPVATFTPQSGQWVRSNQTYNQNAVQATSVSLAPIHLGDPTHGGTTDFTLRARMRNPYAGAGNLIGVVFNYESAARYAEVVFSPTGVAKINTVINGVATTVATANYGGTRNVAFDVTLQMLETVSVLVDGKRIFSNVTAQPSGREQGGVGLVTHWAPARFDNVRFDHGVFQGCSETFSDPSTVPAAQSGTWNTSGGTLNSTGVGQNDIVALNCLGNFRGDDSGTNFTFRARLLNEYAASGNTVGLIYNYTNGPQGPEYYEVVFSSTGTETVNKVIEGVRYPMAQVTQNLPRNTWFDVVIQSIDHHTFILVNDLALVQDLEQGELGPGKFGVITHWSKGRFDNVTVTSLPPPFASEL